MLTDLSIPPHKSSLIVDYFGLKTSVTSLHVYSSQKLNKYIISGICIPNNNFYTIKVFKPIKVSNTDDYQQSAQLIWDKYYKFIKSNPAPWIWMYKHWRYKPQNSPENKYPSYSNIKPKFERALNKK